MLFAERGTYHVSPRSAIDEDAGRAAVDGPNEGEEAAGIPVGAGERLKANTFAAEAAKGRFAGERGGLGLGAMSGE